MTPDRQADPERPVRYQVEHNEQEPGARYALIDTERSPDPADRGGLVLGDVYERDVAVRIVSLLNGEHASQVEMEREITRLKGIIEGLKQQVLIAEEHVIAKDYRIKELEHESIIDNNTLDRVLNENSALEQHVNRIAELEAVRHNWDTALSDTELSDPDYMRGYASDFGMDIQRCGEHIKKLQDDLDAVLTEAIWAMEKLLVERECFWADACDTTSDSETIKDKLANDWAYQRACAFLASPIARKKEKHRDNT